MCVVNNAVFMNVEYPLQLSKFLRKMQEEDFLKIKDQKGVESITEIYRDHPE